MSALRPVTKFGEQEKRNAAENRGVKGGGRREGVSQEQSPGPRVARATPTGFNRLLEREQEQESDPAWGGCSWGFAAVRSAATHEPLCRCWRTCFAHEEVVDRQHAASVGCVKDPVAAQLPGPCDVLRRGMDRLAHFRVVQPNIRLTDARSRGGEQTQKQGW